ncbi:hypothetical protein G7B40_021725 [Aetokthonos hydrillicola Thurmond2011]|jgi:hypothetical protein|uniref:Uncharacterized protein n=1 Tax=Aetokthonos hydrillicola Thurmond2011 TaxID=2712845 RepID=A0AAP5ICF0_9CYAN|nr:hypothetical protein [Aetokthonos hydrillicola]MBO3457789.1 hypothetical protein [Aetokthonos hydrillicola CCALA 1050]MBW4588353.1 hypothetical protein [Aetokthonos hydrillicola CCALA 1050]MDR9897163.1 hypothetical protein [Aetokthonos hydrillicola Thurmond2011]
MAWVFSLSAECGQDQDAAERFSNHFKSISWVLSNGFQSQCFTTIFQDIDSNWWCRVCPNGISELGIESPDSAYLMTELGILLYQHLHLPSAPSFRYALVGVEVDEFRTYSELLNESPDLRFPGLVLSDRIWQAIASPSRFRPFRAGYVWQPYEGEVYKPLMVSPTLKEQMNRLLVA